MSCITAVKLCAIQCVVFTESKTERKERKQLHLWAVSLYKN